MISGFKAPFRAFSTIIKSPKIISLILIPLSINIILYLGFFYYGHHALQILVQSLVGNLNQSLPAWANWVPYLAEFSLKILSWILLIFISVISFTIISGIIAAPFNDLLSIETEKVYRRINHLKMNDLTQHHSFFQIIKLELKRTAVLIIFGVLTLILGLLPLMQIPAFILGSLLISFEYFGIPMSRKTDSLLKVVFFTFRNLFQSVGFGCFFLLLMMVPFASIIYIPLAVIAGTILTVDLEK